MNRVYLAGPMRGRPAHNYPAFDYAASVLRNHGFTAVSPADLGRDGGYTDVDAETTFTRDELALFMSTDLDALTDCDAVLVLEGWEHSSGAAVEIAYAKFLGVPVFQHLSQLLEARAAAA